MDLTIQKLSYIINFSTMAIIDPKWVLTFIIYK